MMSPRRRSPVEPAAEAVGIEGKGSIVDCFERQVDLHPLRTAVKTGRARLTYEGLNRAANGIARSILKLRGQSNEPVAIFLGQGASLISAIFGVLKAGKSYVALDTSFPLSDNAAIAKHCRPALLLTDSENHTTALKLAGNDRQLLIIDDTGGTTSENPALSIPPETTACIIYTSGSTGDPKGVSHSHRNVVHNSIVCAGSLHIAAEDRCSLLWSCSFMASVSAIFGTLLNGAALFPFDIKKNGIHKLAEWLIREEITIYHSVPTVYRNFLASLDGTETFPELRLIKLSGEPVTRRDADLCRKYFRKDCIFHVAYGTTETNIIRQFFCSNDTPFDSGIVPVGYAVDGMEILVLDGDGREAATGSAGEIAVKSPYLALGYYRREDLTEASFLPAGGRDGSCRIYKTGDVGRLLPDGCLLHLGRKDRQIKIRGYRADTGRVEEVLNSFAPIHEAVVEGREEPYGGMSLAAYIVLREGQNLTAGDVRKYLKESLPDYMVPARFIFLDALPLTLSGKIDRRALPEPDNAGPGVSASHAAPRTPTELMLAGIWKKVLGVRQIGVHDNFFEFGGHSLLAAQVVSEIRRQTGKTLPLAALYQMPTIDQIAHALSKESTAPAVSSVLTQKTGSRRPLFWVGVNIYLPRYLGPDQPLYGIISQGQFGRPVIHDSVEEVAAHLIKEIRRVQPSGPYLLGGHCFPGMVALEMAQQLSGQGEDIALLCLVDPPGRAMPGAGACSSSSPPADAYGAETPSSGGIIAAFLLRLRRSRIAKGIKLAICKTSLFLGRPVPTALRDFYYMGIAVYEIAGKYNSRIYAGRTVVFLSEKNCSPHPDVSRLAAGELTVHNVPDTTHMSIINEPSHVALWARQLNHHLDKIHGREKS